MDYEIKRLRLQELKISKERIVSLMRQLTPENDNEIYLKKYDELEKYISDGSAIVFAAFFDRIMQGYIWGYHRMNHGSERVHVTQFIVDRRYRNLGIGRELMAEINRYSAEKGYSAIELNVLPYNLKGIRFYRSCGFEPENIFMKKDHPAAFPSDLGGVLL